MVADKKISCDLAIGQIVKSKAGRDKGDIFIVYDIIDENYVLVVDGKTRKISKPKKKKLMHLQRYNTVINDFIKMKEEINFNDALVRSLLSEQK